MLLLAIPGSVRKSCSNGKLQLTVNIGKSVFLVYLLLSRILRGLNTFVRTASLFFSFTALGFTSFTDQPSFETYIADSGLTNMEGILIYDANEGIQPPYIRNASVCWPVLLSSPKSANFKSWVDQTGAILIWMKPWTWNEFFSAWYVFHFGSPSSRWLPSLMLFVAELSIWKLYSPCITTQPPPGNLHPLWTSPPSCR